ncbi:MAG: FHA domain-containing protein [Acidobacteria bacterium]|nr:MAG: FHA domain-containing protein [Acidobacteriota bacterium]
MIVSCPSCKTKYQFEEARFGEAASKRLKCTRCETVFEISRPDAADPLPATLVAAGGPARANKQILDGSDSAAAAAASLPPLAPLPTAKRYSLAVIMGANAGQIHVVRQPRVVLGRGDESDVQLQDSEVSRRHAMIEIHGDEAVVTDLGSTNGTYVDAARVQRATIGSNDEFSLGTTTLMFIVTDAHDGAVE